MQHFWQNPVCFISWCALDECLCCLLKFLTGLTDSQEQLLKGLFVAAIALLWPGDSWAWVVLPWQSWATGLPLVVLLEIHLLCMLLLATAWSPT